MNTVGNKEDLMERLERMPVAVLPSFVGAMTLSNVYNGMGYAWVRHLTMWAATIVLICYIIKIVFTYNNILRKRDIHTFVPSWFVTYNGFMVCCVVGDFCPHRAVTAW